MKIRLLSDIHLDFAPIRINQIDQDLIILAGDIGPHTTGMKFAKYLAGTHQTPVLMVAGNHEFYREEPRDTYTWESTLDDLAIEAHHTDKIVKGDVTFLENGCAVYDNVRFIGATLWTDMDLFGDPHTCAYLVSRCLGDYEWIFTDEGRLLRTDQTIDRHKQSVNYIRCKLTEPFDGPTVVITHHLPSSLSIDPHYKTDKVSAGYASRLEDLILDHTPKLWVHGHTHTSLDYELGETRIVCNPRGYNDENKRFDSELILEV